MSGSVDVISIDSLKLTQSAPSGSEIHSSIDRGDNRNGWPYRGLEGGLQGGRRGGNRPGLPCGSHPGEEGGGHGEPLEARVACLSTEGARDLTAVRAVAARQLGFVAGRVAVGLEGASGSAPHHGVVGMPLGGGDGIAPGGEELALLTLIGIVVDADGDRGLGFFGRLGLDDGGGATTQAQRLDGRSRECDEDEDCELHCSIRGGR